MCDVAYPQKNPFHMDRNVVWVGEIPRNSPCGIGEYRSQTADTPTLNNQDCVTNYVTYIVRKFLSVSVSCVD